MNNTAMELSEFSNIESVLNEYDTYASVTRGISMRPLFRTHRDMVILSKPTEKLKKYDVALYKIGGKYILHRVIGIDEKAGEYLIRGDNTYTLERVPFSSVIARLIAFNRKGKRYDITAASYKIYSRVWVFIYPIRLLFKKAGNLLRRVYRFFFKRKNNSHKK